MCGIAGSISKRRFDGDMASLMSHRGPDDRGIFTDGNLRLEHLRLSIIDTSSRGHQPMETEDGRYTLVYNGEIYNFKILHDDLLAKGYLFKSRTDTEALLYGYQEYGAEVLHKISGIFAFAIYDRLEKELFIARDHFGIKPLYYYYDGDTFLFGSEIKSFLAHPGFKKDVNVNALFNYIQFMYCPGEITPFQNVSRLNPGHYLIIKTNPDLWVSQPKVTRYYDIPFGGTVLQASEEQWIEKIEHALLQAVRSQLLSDVPLGFFLSGGLDSSLLVAMARQIQGDKQFDCFTIDAGSAMKDEGFSNDLHYARLVSQHIGVKLNVIEVKPDILNDFDKMIWHLDEPQADPAAIHVLNISKGARAAGMKVLIGGAGGDDLFTGYRRHLALKHDPLIESTPKVLRKWVNAIIQQIPAANPTVRRMQKAAANLSLSPEDRMLAYFTWIGSSEVLDLFHPDAAAKLEINDVSTEYFRKLLGRIPKEKKSINQMLYLELKTFLVNHNLNYTDKMSMAAGVEARVPYLDLDLVNLSTELPVNLKLKGNETKYVLKKVAEKYLPAKVIYRPKTGFGAPVRTWIKNDLREMVGDRLSEARILQRGIFSFPSVKNMIQKNIAGKNDYSYSILALLAIESWFEQFVD